MDLKIGCDPEFFLSLGGRFISAEGILKGSKWDPVQINKGGVQVDGLAGEFNIDPASTAEEFDENIEEVLNQIREMVRGVDKDIKIHFTPIATFDKDYFDKEIPEHSKILGCDPDFNCLDGSINQAPNIANLPIRTAAGHLHIGFTENEDVTSATHKEDCRFLANHFFRLGNECFTGKPLTREELKRLEYYGGYGSFRPKHYGCELRAPSNLWVGDSISRKNVFNLLKREVNSLAN